MKRLSKEKKKGSLLVQIGIIFGAIFLVVILIFALLQVIGNNVTYFEAKREHLTPTMKNVQDTVEKYIKNLEWYVEYWRKHPEEIKAKVKQLRNTGSVNEEEADLLTTYNSFKIDDIEALSDEEKLMVATLAYQEFSMYLMLSQWQLPHEQLFVIDVNPGTQGFIYDYAIGIETADDEPLLGENLFEEGEEIPETIEEYTQGKSTQVKYERHEFEKDGFYYYVGYYPVLRDGKILYLICILHNWSEYHSTLIRNLIILVAISIAILAIAGFILLHFVNLYAVKPIRKVQNAVREYKNDKVSGRVIEKMDQINQRNELGELSGDVSDLVVEIDRYNEENTKLIGDRKRVEAELTLASAIQNGVLPTVFPDEKDYRLFASMTPAKEVGGDFYDFFPIDDTHVGLVIGDVSGKGVPASLVMMITKMLIKQNALAGASPALVLKKTNETICAENKNDMFVTAWFGILDRTTGKIIASSAGHEYPILRNSRGDFELLKDKHGFVLGGMDMSKYSEYELGLEPGATLFLYSDGAPEATNASNELFGTDRMLEVLNKDPELQPEELCNALTAAIDSFMEDAPQFDDLTMLCIKYNGWN